MNMVKDGMGQVGHFIHLGVRGVRGLGLGG